MTERTVTINPSALSTLVPLLEKAELAKQKIQQQLKLVDELEESLVHEKLVSAEGFRFDNRSLLVLKEVWRLATKEGFGAGRRGDGSGMNNREFLVARHQFQQHPDGSFSFNCPQRSTGQTVELTLTPTAAEILIRYMTKHTDPPLGVRKA